MPHITIAMHKSVRRGVSDIVFNSLLRRGSPLGDIDSVKNTFSSWSNCMAKPYCKWPVIIAIVVVSLIVFSVVWCIVRCACCGMSCCCSCFSFLKCCDCCGGCCDGKKDKPMKYLDDPSYPPRQGYQAPAPMMGGGLGGRPAPPQYAQFEVGRSGLAVDPKPLSEDALPPMPSWDTSAKKHVLAEEEKNTVELGELDPTTGQQIPLMTSAASSTVGGSQSPAHDMASSPYGAQPGQGAGGNGYFGAAAGDPYGQRRQSFGQNGYRGLPSPGPGRGGPSQSQGPAMDGRGRGGHDRGYGPPRAGQGRGFPPSPQDEYMNNGFEGVEAGYSGLQSQRQSSNNTYGSRQYPAQPQRQYSNDSSRPLNPGRQYSNDSSRPLNPGRQYSGRLYDNFHPSGTPRDPSRGPGGLGRIASPPLMNNSGFDFGSGTQQPYSRPSPFPQQTSYSSSRLSPELEPARFDGGSTAPPSYASRSPPPQEPSYPGYRPYQPSAQGGRTQGGSREPQNWDPVQR